MVPADFTGYFAAAAAAAGVLIGLLFVAIALRPETIFGTGATGNGRALAGSAFISLVNSFFISLTALIPQSNLGWPCIVLSVTSLYATIKMQLEIGRRDLHLPLRVRTIATFTYQLVVGAILIASPADSGQVYTVSYLVIALFSVALSRAWALLRGRHLHAGDPARPAHPGTAQPQAARAASGGSGEVAEPAQRAEQQDT